MKAALGVRFFAGAAGAAVAFFAVAMLLVLEEEVVLFTCMRSCITGISKSYWEKLPIPS
ncbi:MAG: hypothetical protein LBE51_02345 [Acidovorax sp.]|jgi:hypothetical protein|nr:hypothetical protein [Acidovorax sp.]